MGSLAYLSLWLLGFFMRAVEADACPREWLQYQGNCYGFFQEKLSWHAAEIECQSYGRGTHLASILAWPETLIVSKHICTYKKEREVDVWIGLHDAHQNGNWRWSDESSYNYRNWMRGEPNNLWKSEYCVALRASAEGAPYLQTHIGATGAFPYMYSPNGHFATTGVDVDPVKVLKGERIKPELGFSFPIAGHKGWIDAVCKKPKAYICKHEL